MSPAPPCYTSKPLGPLSGRPESAPCPPFKTHQPALPGFRCAIPSAKCICVANEAKPVLIEAGFTPESIGLRRIRDNELKPTTIQHLLFVSNIFTKLFLQKQRAALRLSIASMTARHSGITQSGHDEHGKEIKLPVRPTSSSPSKTPRAPMGGTPPTSFGSGSEAR